MASTRRVGVSANGAARVEEQVVEIPQDEAVVPFRCTQAFAGAGPGCE